MPVAWTQTTAPTLWRAAVTLAPRSRRARPPLPTQSAARRVSPSAAANSNIAAKADDVAEAEPVEELEQLDVAEAPIGQDRHRHIFGKKRLQTAKAEVLEVVALVLQFILAHREPQERRRAAVAGDEVQRERGLLSASKSVQLIATTIASRWPTISRTHGANSSHTTTPALLSRRSTCLIACLSTTICAPAPAHAR